MEKDRILFCFNLDQEISKKVEVVVPSTWSQVVKMKQAAMAAAAEFTWSNAALQYEAVFQELGVKDVLNGHLARSKK